MGELENYMEGYKSGTERLVERIKTRLNDPKYIPFELSNSFVNKYRSIRPPFGFNGLGDLTYMRTYSRTDNPKIGMGKNEQWVDTVERVVNGTYNMQKRWIQERGLPWDDYKAQDSAQEMFDRMFNIKFTPPGRGLWAMGSTITEERGVYAALNNCAFVSTENIKEDLSAPFTFLMDASMLGVGVGFDTRGAGKMIIKGPDRGRRKEIYEIPDSREGWVDATKLLIESYFLGIQPVELDYSKIRPAGQPIRGFGGFASGPEPLQEAHEWVRRVLEKNIGRPITPTTIVDIQNLIGKCVVAGNVRRTAEIAFGDPYSDEYLDLKNYKVNPHRESYGWASNNSIFADLGMDYSSVAERVKINGEPGFAWLENMRGYGRMKDGFNNKDRRAAGGNPCLEQTLESYELCCLVETYPNRHKTKEDFLRTLKFAYMYAKTVTLGETHWPETNRVMLRNRRIGCSMSGIQQFVANHSLDELVKWSEEGYNTIQKYDEIYSDWMCTPRSIKSTSIKPSGTVSLVAGATPGMHWSESEYYIRRVRLGINSPLVAPLKKASYRVEPAFGSEKNTLVVDVPVHVGEGIRSAKNVSMWEQLSMAALLQEHWADNQVSCTVTFDPIEEGDQIKHALDHFQYKLKGVSLLPRKENGGAYKQMPYEAITREQFKELTAQLKPIDFLNIENAAAIPERYCDGEACSLDSNGSDKKID